MFSEGNSWAPCCSAAKNLFLCTLCVQQMCQLTSPFRWFNVGAFMVPETLCRQGCLFIHFEDSSCMVIFVDSNRLLIGWLWACKWFDNVRALAFSSIFESHACKVIIFNVVDWNTLGSHIPHQRPSWEAEYKSVHNTLWSLLWRYPEFITIISIRWTNAAPWIVFQIDYRPLHSSQNSTCQRKLPSLGKIVKS